jgi:hypothetical protein
MVIYIFFVIEYIDNLYVDMGECFSFKALFVWASYQLLYLKSSKLKPTASFSNHLSQVRKLTKANITQEASKLILGGFL